MNVIPLLCWEFLKTGLFSVGGGLATLPFLYDMASRHSWFTVAELTDMIAVSESTPGPIGVNMATYAGFSAAGIPGALAATLALVAPAIAVIVVISRFLDRFKNSRSVSDAFAGLRPAVTGLIAAAGFQVFSMSVLNMEAFRRTGDILAALSWIPLALFAALFILLMKTAWHPAAIIAIGAGAGIVLGL